MLQHVTFFSTLDQGQPHYHIETFNISAQDLTNGRREHEALKCTYSNEKKVLTAKNLFNEAFRFWNQSMTPVLMPMEYCVLYMLQSKNYTFSADWIASNHKLNLVECNVLWNLVHHPETATLDMVTTLLFDARSYGRKVRFYMHAYC
jgi:hypothetical protein